MYKQYESLIKAYAPLLEVKSKLFEQLGSQFTRSALPSQSYRLLILTLSIVSLLGLDAYHEYWGELELNDLSLARLKLGEALTWRGFDLERL